MTSNLYPLRNFPDRPSLDSRVVTFDIETTVTVPDGSGLDPATSAVSDIAFYGDGVELCFGARGSHGTEKDLLTVAARLVGSFDDEVVLVGWNTSGFDLPYLAARYEATGVPGGPYTWPTGTTGKYGSPEFGAIWAGHRHYDIYPEFADLAAAHGIRHGLKPVARLLGFDPIELDREILDRYTAEEIRAYVLSDVHATHWLWQWLVRQLSAA